MRIRLEQFPHHQRASPHHLPTFYEVLPPCPTRMISAPRWGLIKTRLPRRRSCQSKGWLTQCIDVTKLLFLLTEARELGIKGVGGGRGGAMKRRCDEAA